jgi:hypothetical protein
MKKRALYSIMALTLVLGMALTLAMPVGAATPTFTGDVPTDFTGLGILTIPDTGGVGDVGLPKNALNGTISGWDMVDLRLTYDTSTDTLYVGINTFGIAGDADGDGDPGHTADWLATNEGTDHTDLHSTESIAVYFDLNQDGNFDVIAGVSRWTDVSGFTVANFSGSQWSPASAFGTALPTHTGSYYASPSAADPDFEFTILNFSTLPGQDALLAGFRVWAFMGSQDDDGIGEDFIQYDQSPSTITTIASSAPKVVAGGSVNLIVSEANPIATHSVKLTNTSVQVWKDGVPLPTLEWPPDSGDAADPGVLNVGETWSWTISSGPITATTTFVATGSGIAPGDFPVTYPDDPSERDEVTVNTMGPDTVTTITASATTVQSGGSVDLTVTEQNTGDDPLNNPYVLVNPGSYTLNKASPYYDSGDTNGDGILDTTETWRWTNIPSNPITATTTFVALGFGTDSLGHEVSYAEGYPDERDAVTVNTMPPPVGWETYPINKLAVLAPWIALAAVIISGASLLVLKRRRP